MNFHLSSKLVDSPFPPYKPVNIFSEEELYQFVPASPDTADVAVPSEEEEWIGHLEYSWLRDGVRHRDDDLPAFLIPDLYQEFYCQGTLHRISGAASISAISEEPEDRENYLGIYYMYGSFLDYFSFLEIHRLAIKYELPLWVIVLGFSFRLNFEANNLGEFTVEALKSFGRDATAISTSWILKLWNVDLGGSKPVKPVWSSNIQEIDRVVQYEYSRIGVK